MSTPTRPSGLKPPSKVPKPQTSIPRPSSLQTAVKVEETVAKSAKKAGLSPTDAANHAERTVQVMSSSSTTTTSSGSTTNGSKDNFKVGDRVIVSGTKHGRIQFLGETQFAAGEWAGVVLDEPIGKNDGAVNGIRYFQCEGKKGVFAKPDKLVYESSTTNGTRRSSTSGLIRPAGLPSAPRMGTKVASPRGTVSKDLKTPISISSLAQEDGDNTSLKVGDRVLVSGTKLGILRFVGPTEFAKGEWAGVELDDEMGKNDGAVAGTRYFQCRPKHGLFAPVHKVSKVHTQVSNLVESSRSRRSNSSSSVSSMGSRNYGLNASSGSIMTSKSSELRKMSIPKKSSIATPTSSTRRLSKVKRPDGKMSRSSSQSSLLSDVESVDMNENVKDNREETEHEIALLKLRHEKYVRDSEENLDTVKSLLESADREKVQILQQLEEERRKVEDYQFRLEEATINSSDMKAEYEGGSEKMKELEASLKVESDKAMKFFQDIDDLKNQIENKDFKIAELETEMSVFMETMETYKNELEESKERNSRLETSQMDNDQTTQQLELKVNRVAELEKTLEELQHTKAEQRTQLDDVEMKLKEEKSCKEQADTLVQELQTKLSEKETSLDSNISLLNDTKSSLQEVERRLQASDSKIEQLTEDKRKLEGDISELIKNSGNSSEQLTSMNEDLRAKDRRIEEIQQELSEANQKISKISDELGQTKDDKEEKINKLEEKQDEERAGHKKQTENLQAQLEQSQSHAAAIQVSSNTTIQELRDQLNGEIEALKKVLETKDVVLEQERRERGSLENRVQVAESEMKSAKEEKVSFENNFKQVSQDRDKLREERDQALADRQKTMSEKTELILKQEEVHLKHQTLMDQIEKEALARTESTKVSEDLKASLEKVTQERDAAMKERTEAMANYQENGMKLASKEQEVQNLKNEVGRHKEEVEQVTTALTKTGEVDTDRVRKQLMEANQEIDSTKMLLSGMEQDKLDLESQLQRLQAENTEQREKLEKELEEAKALLQSVTEEKRQKDEEEVNVRRTLDSTKEKMDQKEEKFSEMKLEMEQLQQQFQTEKVNRSKEEAKMTGLEAILVDTKQELEQKVSKLENLESSHKSTSADLHSTQQAKIALEEELGSLKKQVDSYREQVTAAQQEGESSQGILQAELMDTKQALDLAQTKAQRLEETEQTLLSQLTATKEQKEEMQKELEGLQRQLDNSKQQYETVQKSTEKSDADVSDLKTQLSETKQTLEQKQQNVTELEETISKLQSENTSRQTDLQQVEQRSSNLQQELDKAREGLVNAQEGLVGMETLHNQMSDLKKDLYSERSKVNNFETEKVRLEASLQSLKEKEASGAEQMMTENTTLTEELESLKKKLEEEMSRFEDEKTSMTETINVTHGLVAEQEQQVQQYKQEITVLRVEVSEAGSQKELVERLEGERLMLEDKVTGLETSLQDMQHQTQNTWEKSSNPGELDEDGDPAMVRLQEEREMAEGQVSFLNSVIVDLQHKNDELRIRLEAMENGYTLNGNMDHDLSDLDLEPSNHGPPLRLFCDICDVFDLHDTEDCPLQASSDSPPPTQHHGQRGEERPYCDTCEIFGHWTESCDDEQTY